ncbi:Ubiquinol oxidase [Rhynchospora pubera]|uniref:Ubiquinol oxidase n=1 Tax=Rhynchospora pubera TaxID=906938 RepID=A0AAV8E1R1_9POAL|nr:Ubiquinol oxidase [Rhynchospora pubera]
MVVHRFRSAGAGVLSFASLKRKSSNTASAVRDAYLSTKEVFERHRVVFTIGTSIASVLTAWAGYSIRHAHQTNVEKRLRAIEESLKNSYDVEHEEIKKIVSSGNVSMSACVATAWTTLVIGYALGWRGGSWYTNRRIQREQLKSLGQIKPRRWKLKLPSRPLIQPLLKFRSSRTNLKSANSSPAPATPPASSSDNITT